MWKSGNNLVELSDCIQKDINEIMEWNRKWKININADKTEYCIISKLKQHHGHTIFKLNNKILKYNRNSKLLGVRDRPFNLKGRGALIRRGALNRRNTVCSVNSYCDNNGEVYV